MILINIVKEFYRNMKHTEITTYITLGISFINIIVSIYIAINQPKAIRINPILESQLNKIFVPFQNSINKKLFKQVNEDTITEIHSALTKLYNEVKDTELEFGLSFYTVYYLKEIVESNIPVSKKQFKTYNKKYRQFSNSYLKDLNKLRGKIGLPKYREDYRITFGLYPNKINETLRIYGIGFLLAVLYLIFLK